MVYYVLNRGVSLKEREDPAFVILSDWPLPRPADWLEIVNRPESEAELEALRHCVQRGAPFGSADWTATITKQLRIESSLRARGRPREES
jgi:putative transposase